MRHLEHGTSCLSALVACLAQQDSRFVEHRLSGDLAVVHGAAVAAYVPSPDGSQIAFTREDALYVSATDGSSIETLVDSPGSAPLEGLLWTLDGTRLVYGNLYGSGPIRVAPADGSGAPLQLAPGGVPRAIVDGGSRLLFSTNTTLQAVPLDGSTSAYVLMTSSPLITPDRFGVDASGSWLVFSNQGWIYSVPVDGSAAPLQISASSLTNPQFEQTPSGLVLYRTDGAVWTVPVDGSGLAQQITPTMISSREVTGFHATPDGNRAVYLSDLTNNNVYELYSVPITGSSTPLRLTPMSSGSVLAFRLSPDGDHALYADQGGRLFSVRTDGSAPPVDLHWGFSSMESWESLAFTPDSSELVLLDIGELLAYGGLFSGPVDGSTPVTRLDLPLHDHSAVRAFAVTPDSARVLFVADGVRDERYELFWIELATRMQGRLSGPLLGHADVEDFKLDTTGSTVFWRADSLEVGRTDLFSRPIDGSLPPVLLRSIGAPSTVGSVGSFLASRGRVFFLADVTTPREQELFFVRDDGRAPARRLNPLSHGNVSSFLVDPAGEWVVFESEADAEGREELFRVPVDGSSPASRLHAPLEEGQSVQGFALSPDGTHVVYRLSLPDRDGVLYTIPTAGGPPVLLESSTSIYSITPDSSSIVYRNEESQLSLVPIDGSLPPRVLVEAPAPLSFRTTATHVVYRTGGLFSVPLAGGLPLELNDPMPPGGEVVDHLLTPDGAWVVYRADALVNERFLLLRVATDRSSPPLVLNGPLAAGADVTSFFLTTSGSHAIYSVQALKYAVPVVGGPVLQLPGPASLPPAGDYVVCGNLVVPLDGSPSTPLPPYQLYGFWSDGQRLLMHSNDPSQLLSVKLDGSQKHFLTPPLAGYGTDWRISGSGVVYREARGTPEVLELFSSQPRKAARAP